MYSSKHDASKNPLGNHRSLPNANEKSNLYIVEGKYGRACLVDPLEEADFDPELSVGPDVVVNEAPLDPVLVPHHPK